VRFAVKSALVAVGVLLLAGSGQPASAAAPLGVRLIDRVVAPGYTTWVTTAADPNLVDRSDQRFATIDFDTTAAERIGTVREKPEYHSPRCGALRQHRLHCRVQVSDLFISVGLEIVTSASARPGTIAVVPATIRIAEGPARALAARIEVGEPVNLVGDGQSRMSVQRGEDFALPVAVTNNSDVHVRGIAVTFTASRGITTPSHYSNCRYHLDMITACWFGQVAITPGQELAAMVPLRMPTTSGPYGDRVRITWQPAAEFAAEYRASDDDYGRFGTGAPLLLHSTTMTPVRPVHSSRPAQAEVSVDDNSRLTTLVAR